MNRKNKRKLVILHTQWLKYYPHDTSAKPRSSPIVCIVCVVSTVETEMLREFCKGFTLCYSHTSQ